MASTHVRPSCHQEDSWLIVESLHPPVSRTLPVGTRIALDRRLRTKADFETPLTVFALPLPTGCTSRSHGSGSYQNRL